MKIELLRKLDYWMGIPLCFLISLWSGMKENFIKKNKRVGNRKVKRIIFIKLSETGSIILSFPFLHRIKTEYPEAEIFFLTFEKNSDVFKILTNIIDQHRVITIRDDSFFTLLPDICRAIKRIRRLNTEICFDLELFSRFTCALTYLTGAGYRAGFYRYSMEGLYRGSFLTHRFSYNPFLHISYSYLSMLEAMRCESKMTPELESNLRATTLFLPRYRGDARIQDQTRKKLDNHGVKKYHKLILLNPGEGSLPIREWPLENYIELCRKLIDIKDCFFVLIGTEGACLKGQALFDSLPEDRRANLINKTTLEELMELFRAACALVTNDCGLAHLSALTDVKKFIFFGPESPNLYGPLDERCCLFYEALPCSPCLSAFNHRKTLCRDNKCLKRITPEGVYQQIKDNL